MSHKQYKPKVQYVKINNKIVAAVRGDLLDIRKHKDHLEKIPPAIGIAVETIRKAESLGVVDIQVTVLETGQLYTCSLEHFKEFSFEQARGGYEIQKHLTLDYWTTSLDVQSKAAKAGEVRIAAGNGQRTRNPKGLLKSEPAARQMGLFR